MAYDLYLADRIDNVLNRKIGFYETKKMMGGLCYMVDDKMCVGVVGDKLMCRVGKDAYEHAVAEPHCTEMAFTGKPLKGYVFVLTEGIVEDFELEKWIDLCLAFNPHAKSSKKKKS